MEWIPRTGGIHSIFDLMPAGGRLSFPRRGLLPSPREALLLRQWEQNLHTFPAPSPGAGCLFRGAVCSPLPARPCCFVWGSKIFTQFPRPRPAPAAFSGARFAPPSPLCLRSPSGGANSSHYFRGPVAGRAPIKKIPWRPAPRDFFLPIFLIFLYLSISGRWDSGVRK